MTLCLLFQPLRSDTAKGNKGGSLKKQIQNRDVNPAMSSYWEMELLPTALWRF